MLRAKLLIIVLLTIVSATSAQDIDYPDVPETYEFDEFEDVPDTDIGALEDPALFPHSEVHDWLVEAVDNVNSLPDDLTQVNGTSAVADETATQLFSYMRWMFSGASAREILGETLAPIGLNLYILLFMSVVLAAAWVTVRIVALLLRFVIFVIRRIIDVIPFT